MAVELKLFQPQIYIETFLNNNIRPDERELMSFRPVLINLGCIGTANGSALVRLGKTAVVCGIKAELTNPTSNEPGKGFLVPNVTMSSLCSSQFIPGPPSEQAQVCSQMIMDLWKNSSFILPEDLCIVEGKLCWCLFVEMTCLDYSGNILDACILAMMAAIRNTLLPEVLVDDDKGIEVTDKTSNIKLNCVPFSTTYAVFKNGVVADPTSEEETLADGKFTVFLNEDGTIYSIQSFGSVSEEHVFNCFTSSKIRCAELKSLLNKGIE